MARERTSEDALANTKASLQTEAEFKGSLAEHLLHIETDCRNMAHNLRIIAGIMILAIVISIITGFMYGSMLSAIFR